MSVVLTKTWVENLDISDICVVCFGYLKYCWMFWPCRNWWVFRYVFKYIDEKNMMRIIMKTGFTWLGSHDAESHFPELMVSVSCLFLITTCLIVITYHIITLQRKWPHVSCHCARAHDLIRSTGQSLSTDHHLAENCFPGRAVVHLFHSTSRQSASHLGINRLWWDNRADSMTHFKITFDFGAKW